MKSKQLLRILTLDYTNTCTSSSIFSRVLTAMGKNNLLQLSAIGIIVICNFAFTSCSKDSNEETIPLPPNPLNESTLKFKETAILEFKEVPLQGSATDIPENSAPTYFGKRLQLACPVEIQFKGDSLSIIKSHGLVEKYKTKWEKDVLSYHNVTSDTWEYMGEKRSNGNIALNFGMYIKKNASEQRTLTIMGQAYELTSYASLHNGNGDTASLTWLKVNFIFE